jgi:hypothetical protein
MDREQRQGFIEPGMATAGERGTRPKAKGRKTMSKLTFKISILVLALALTCTLVYAQQQGVQQQGGWTCPGMKHWGRGHHGGHQGHGMGSCGLGIGRIMHQNQGKPMTKEQAQLIFERYVERKGNPNLKVGDVVEKGEFFEASITTREGSLVERIQMDKNTGWFRNAT